MSFYPVTNGKMHKNIDVKYYFKEVNDLVEESIKQYVEDNVNTKMDAYFKKILSRDDARISMQINIAKHGKGQHKTDDRYDGTFLFTVDGKDYPPYKRDGDRAFENVRDLVNHAFDHLKEQLASEKEGISNIPKDKTQPVQPIPG